MTTNSSIRLDIPANLQQLSAISLLIDDALGKVDKFPNREQIIYNVQLAVQEICTNVIKHAYKHDDSERINVEFIMKTDRFEILIIDHGVSFDISTLPEINLDDPQIGGYGLFLAQRLLDEVQYHPQPNDNHWRLVKYFQEQQ